jgi:hypothetical protein
MVAARGPGVFVGPGDFSGLAPEVPGFEKVLVVLFFEEEEKIISG